MNYTDPTGHIACWDEHANDPECKGKTATAAGIVESKYSSNSVVDQPKNISKDGLDFIKNKEIYEQFPYTDSIYQDKGNCTVGYGFVLYFDPCDGRPITSIELNLFNDTNIYKNGIDEKTAAMLLNEKLTNNAEYIHKVIKVDLSQPQFDMLISLAYNAGNGIIDQTSSIAYLLNNFHSYQGIPNEFRQVIYDAAYPYEGKDSVGDPALVKRREEEINIWENGY